MFKGFELFKVTRAVTTTSPDTDTDTTHSYELEIHSMNGIHKDKVVMTIVDLRRTYGKEFGRTKCPYGMLQQGEVETLTLNEYNDAVARWNAI
jgi:hypothetical protein